MDGDPLRYGGVKGGMSGVTNDELDARLGKMKHNLWSLFLPRTDRQLER